MKVHKGMLCFFEALPLKTSYLDLKFRAEVQNLKM